jgi:glycosyltransferase involved in cell wall biosynthesis
MNVEVLPAPSLRNRPASVQPPDVDATRATHLNLLIASMTLGGAERSVRDVVHMLEDRVGSGNLFVMARTAAAYRESDIKSFRVVHPAGADRRERLRRVAMEILASPNPTVFTHLIRSGDLRLLWDYGVRTIPVIHNSAPGWHEEPTVFHHPLVPAVVAVCQSVADQLKAAGLDKPISVLRHELSRRDGLRFDTDTRQRVRHRHGIAETTLLLGMVGQFKSHKGYVRAIRVLAELRRARDVKLMIIGGWDHDYGAGRVAYAATMEHARELGVMSDLICLGPSEDVEAYYAAFDVFLNTSVYEGMSIATLEAVRAGCPVVSADVGGQREAVTANDSLIAQPADIDAYVRAILHQCEPARRMPLEPPPQPDLIARLWAWIGDYGLLRPGGPGCRADTLFVTSNLNPGGAQRSLANLLKTMSGGQLRPWLCVLDRVLGDGFMSQINQAGIPNVGLAGARNLVDRVEASLELVRRLGVRTICFWNVDPIFKLIVAKVLQHSEIRIVDVSPGPMLFEELANTRQLQDRLAFSADDYFRRLDVFVSKYRDGIPEPVRRLARKVVVIPNGVAQRLDQPMDARMLPTGVDARYALVTCCRLVPNKRLEWLVEMMRELTKAQPLASLTIVGGVDQRHLGYLQTVQDRIAHLGLTNIHFAGPNSDVFSFLGLFKIFVMISRAQGCPNASLEAMACGLPVVANADGGTSEQVRDGVSGYLVDSEKPAEMAERVAYLLERPDLMQEFGAAGRIRAAKRFSLELMARRYQKIL